LVLADRVDVAVNGLVSDRDRLAGQINDEKSKLTVLQEQHAEVAAQLEARTAEEDKFRMAKEMLNPSEGEVLYNASNDLVLRLSGLSFDIGKSDIKDSHVPLLEKVKTIIEMFPESKLAVEGHTDATGDPKANVQLSEKRAYAVMQYLRQSMLLSADRINAIGYGSEKPVASNETSEGRAKNRRIDIVIMK
ncbi:MAG: OmpA family protein, partial [candidate division Zixibacteria bacterium]|nr:OmpA family protein [candidate division Zixibacteria bacterium]